jgi:hypothetical protein
MRHCVGQYLVMVCGCLMVFLTSCYWLAGMSTGGDDHGI